MRDASGAAWFIGHGLRGPLHVQFVDALAFTRFGPVLDAERTSPLLTSPFGSFDSPPGTHALCAYAINDGWAAHTLLGCRDMTIPSGPPARAIDSALGALATDTASPNLSPAVLTGSSLRPWSPAIARRVRVRDRLDGRRQRAARTVTSHGDLAR